MDKKPKKAATLVKEGITNDCPRCGNKVIVKMKVYSNGLRVCEKEHEWFYL